MKKPFPEGQIYVTAANLAERYEVGFRTIHRWAKKGFLPLTIDSEMDLSRWDIEELQDYEDDVKRENPRYSKYFGKN